MNILLLHTPMLMTPDGLHGVPRSQSLASLWFDLGYPNGNPSGVINMGVWAVVSLDLVKLFSLRVSGFLACGPDTLAFLDV